MIEVYIVTAVCVALIFAVSAIAAKYELEELNRYLEENEELDNE